MYKEMLVALMTTKQETSVEMLFQQELDLLKNFKPCFWHSMIFS